MQALRGLMAALLCCTALAGHAREKVIPYKGYTGTVHQFGFIGGLYNTSNPNMTVAGQTETYHDFGLGVVYNLHDYVTRQFTFEVISSVTVVTNKALNLEEFDEKRQKLVWPVDCRFLLGPSEDFQAFIGQGLQWNMLDRADGAYSMTTGMVDSRTIHQLSGNTAVGLNILGPQKYMVHFNVGAKFHYPITDNDDTPFDPHAVDMAKDRSCVVLNGGITLDIDKHKRAALMLNYEYPLATPKSELADGGFFSNTQTISLGLVFHIGGTR